MKRHCTAFLLSDMMDFDSEMRPRYEDALKIACNRHDISAINIYDPREREIPDVGLVHVADAENGEQAWVDTSSRKVRESYEKWNAEANAVTKQVLNKYRIDTVSISTGEDYVKGLITFFNRRG